MKRIAVVLIILFGSMLSSGSAQSTWERVDPGSAAFNKGVYMPDTKRAYVASSGGGVRVTSDGGTTWNVLSTPTEVDLWGVYAAADAAQPVIYVGGDNGTLFKTTDGGYTWNPQDVKYSTGFLFGLFGYDTNNLCITGGEGEFGNSVGVIVTTHDGGTTWKKSVIEGTYSFDKSCFVSPMIGYAAGSIDAGFAQGVICKTTDGGDSWDRVATTPGAANSIYCFDATHCIVSGFNGLVMRTTDGGVTWNSSAVPAQFSSDPFTHVAFVDRKLGYITDAAGAILKSTDGGVTWMRDESFEPGSAILWSLATVKGEDEYLAMAVGDEGAIYRLKSSGSAASVILQGVNETVARIDIQPNPITSTSTLKIAMQATETTIVTLVDILGQRVRAIFDGRTDSGTLTLPLDTRDLPPGLYYCRVQSAGSSVSRQVVITR
jgi:photosystem II stability/assembly factor-like uncharacterized protein